MADCSKNMRFRCRFYQIDNIWWTPKWSNKPLFLDGCCERPCIDTMGNDMRTEISLVTLGVMVSVLLAVLEPTGLQNTLYRSTASGFLVGISQNTMALWASIGFTWKKNSSLVCGGLLFSEKFSGILGKLKQKGFYNILDLSNLMTYLLHLLLHKELKN